ncbi:MAG: fibronectin type III domain-containing protein, partial [Bacteroidaceae bacterium]|nr:fibronectin type III domain-containing protein [Bacteroidaceae bacterium]
LKDPCYIESMEPVVATPLAYIVRNQGHTDEYYMLENHQTSYDMGEYHNWDAGLLGSGMLVTHIDYSATAWSEKKVNTDPSHQRCAYISANGKSTVSAANLFPYGGRYTALTNTTVPAATVFNKNKDGSYFMNKPIENIKQTNGLISFKFDGGFIVETPDAMEATNVKENSFTANWRPVEDADEYALELTLHNPNGKDTLFCEDLASNEKFAEKVSADVSSTINNYLTSGCWSALNTYVEVQKLRLGSTTKAGKLETSYAPAPEDGKVTIKVGVQKYGGNATNFYVRLFDRDNNLLKQEAITPPTDAEVYTLQFDDIATDFKVMFITATKQAYITYLECKQIPDPVVYEHISTTSYAMENLEPGRKYSYRVQTIMEGHESLWSRRMYVQLTEPTGITDTPQSDEDKQTAPIYNLQGQRVANTGRGIYIQGNKKILK